jgi:hypothetical protein
MHSRFSRDPGIVSSLHVVQILARPALATATEPVCSVFAHRDSTKPRPTHNAICLPGKDFNTPPNDLIPRMKTQSRGKTKKRKSTDPRHLP